MKETVFRFVILLIIIIRTNALIQLANYVTAPSPMIVKLIQDGRQTFDIQWALSPNTTQMFSNLSIIASAGSSVPSTAFWLPLNTTIAVSVLQLGSFLSPNGTVFILTKTDIHPFKSVEFVTVNIPSNYQIMALERAFHTSNCTTVYALLSTKFLGSATLVAEISVINGTLMRQFNASALVNSLGLSDIWDIPSSENIFAMMNGAGIISLNRNSFELIKIYKPRDGIFSENIVGGAILINTDTIIWSNVTRETNLTELRIWNFTTQDNSSSILLSNDSFKDLELMSSFIGIDYNTGNIWTVFMSLGSGMTLATSVIYHYINESKVIHEEIRWTEWLGWVQNDHSQIGTLIIDDSLIVVTRNNSNFVLIQKFVDNDLIE